MGTRKPSGRTSAGAMRRNADRSRAAARTAATLARCRWRSPPWIVLRLFQLVPDAEVRRFDQRDPQPAQGGVPRDRRAAHASADDEQVVLPRGQGAEVALQRFPESAFTTRARRALSSSGICLNSKPTS